MKKTDATELLGDSPTVAAKMIGITAQAYSQWPEILTPRLIDRVQAAIARKHLPPSVLGIEQSEVPPPDQELS